MGQIILLAETLLTVWATSQLIVVFSAFVAFRHSLYLILVQDNQCHHKSVVKTWMLSISRDSQQLLNTFSSHLLAQPDIEILHKYARESVKKPSRLIVSIGGVKLEGDSGKVGVSMFDLGHKGVLITARHPPVALADLPESQPRPSISS